MSHEGRCWHFASCSCYFGSSGFRRGAERTPTIVSKPNKVKLINPPIRPSPTLHIRTDTSHDFDVSSTRRGVAGGGGWNPHTHGWTDSAESRTVPSDQTGSETGTPDVKRRRVQDAAADLQVRLQVIKQLQQCHLICQAGWCSVTKLLLVLLQFIYRIFDMLLYLLNLYFGI